LCGQIPAKRELDHTRHLILASGLLVAGCYLPPSGYHWVQAPGAYNAAGIAAPNDPARSEQTELVYGRLLGPATISRPPPQPRELPQDNKVRDCKGWADQLLQDSPLGVRVTSRAMPNATVEQLHTFAQQRNAMWAECDRDPHALDAAKRAYVEQIKQNALTGY